MKLTFWGVRGSIPSPGKNTNKYGGNTPCVTVEAGEHLIIFDAGSGIRLLGNHLIKSGKAFGNLEAYLFISHTHWDHIQGFPFFVPAFVANNKIKIYGPETFNLNFEKILAGQMNYAYFPIRLRELESNMEYIEVLDGVHSISKEIKIRTQLLNHPIIDMGYRMEYNNHSIGYLTDYEIFSPAFIKTILTGKSSQEKELLEYALVESKKKIQRFINNLDVLIIDSVYTQSEYNGKIGWGHNTFENTFDLAIESGVKNLYFFHHEPNRTDDELDKIVKKFRKKNKSLGLPLLTINAAKENTSIDFE